MLLHFCLFFNINIVKIFKQIFFGHAGFYQAQTEQPNKLEKKYPTKGRVKVIYSTKGANNISILAGFGNKA